MRGPKIADQFFDADQSAEEWAENGRWVNVVSSDVAAIRYDAERRELWVEFKDGSIYFYPQVMPSLAMEMYNCSSMGKFIWKIRGMGYVGQRVKKG